ncbi:Tat pathway signal protein [Roseobacteraceae bacterium S113]
MALSRRAFIAATLAASGARLVPLVGRTPAKRVLTLVYDKSIGAMRAVDRLVP